MTSRNAVLPVRRFLARRWPDAMKSNGGGANAILSRVGLAEVRRVRLRAWPERRVAQLARIPSGPWLANYHASTAPPRARQELARLWSLGGRLAGEDPLVLGGDLNLRAPETPQGALHAGERDVDHIFAWRLQTAGEARVLDRSLADGLVLSDHPPLLATLSSGAGVTASA